MLHNNNQYVNIFLKQILSNCNRNDLPCGQFGGTFGFGNTGGRSPCLVTLDGAYFAKKEVKITRLITVSSKPRDTWKCYQEDYWLVSYKM